MAQRSEGGLQKANMDGWQLTTGIMLVRCTEVGNLFIMVTSHILMRHDRDFEGLCLPRKWKSRERAPMASLRLTTLQGCKSFFDCEFEDRFKRLLVHCAVSQGDFPNVMWRLLGRVS